MSFIHLNVHSDYSRGWGVGTIDDICRTARDLGIQRLALTDTNGIYGLRFFSYLFYPVIFIFSRVARFATRLVGGGSVPQNMFITREELRVLLDLSESASDPSTIDRKRIRRIIRFADTTVGEAMIPLADVVGFNENRDMQEAIRVVMSHGYNRLPVYRGNLTVSITAASPRTSLIPESGSSMYSMT